MCIKIFFLVLFFFVSRYQVSSFTIGTAPYAYAECNDVSLNCFLYGKIDMNNYMPQIIGHYRNRNLDTINLTQNMYQIPADLTEFTADMSPKPYLKFPHDLIRYGKSVSSIKISMNTSIDTMAFNGLIHLQHIELSNIQNISSKSVSNLFKLKSFKLYDVNMKEIPENMIFMCDNLEKIIIHNCTIESFSSRSFYSLFNVNTLQLKSLKVGIFQEGPFSGMINLQNLLITNSELISIKSSWFKFLPKLTRLDLSYNQITKIDENSFKKLSNLKVLDLSHNQLTQLTNEALLGLKQLQFLDCSYNKLKTLPVISHLSQLKVFNFSHNQVDEASTEYLSQNQELKIVDLTNNRINNLTIDSLETNYKLAINVEFLSKDHYLLLNSSSNSSRNEYTNNLNETLMDTISCSCDWTWINENVIKENDYYLMATKKCNSDSSVMLYQYLHDTCNSILSYDFVTTVDIMFPQPEVPVLETSNQQIAYDNYYTYGPRRRSNEILLNNEQCQTGCKIIYKRMD